MCWGETPIPVWIRLCLASRRASAATSISLYGARERADRRLGDGLRNFEHGVEVSGAGDRESRLDDVHAEAFQQLGDLDLFDRVQLAAGNLLAVAERGVEKCTISHSYSVRSSDVGRSFDRSESVFSCKKPCVRPYPLGLPLSESALSAAKEPKPAGISAAGPGRMSCISERVNLVARSFVAGVRNGRFGGF